MLGRSNTQNPPKPRNMRLKPTTSCTEFEPVRMHSGTIAKRAIPSRVRVRKESCAAPDAFSNLASTARRIANGSCLGVRAPLSKREEARETAPVLRTRPSPEESCVRRVGEVGTSGETPLHPAFRWSPRQVRKVPARQKDPEPGASNLQSVCFAQRKHVDQGLDTLAQTFWGRCNHRNQLDVP
jgi:hypothetical protein